MRLCQGGAGGLSGWRRWTARVAQVDCQGGAGGLSGSDTQLVSNFPWCRSSAFFRTCAIPCNGDGGFVHGKGRFAWMKLGLRHSVQRRWWFRPRKGQVFMDEIAVCMDEITVVGGGTWRLT